METGREDQGPGSLTRLAWVCRALNKTGSKYFVIGGAACALHGHVRATQDIDILIEATLDNAKCVLAAHEGVGWGFAKEWLAEEIVARPITLIGDDPRIHIFTVAWSVRYGPALPRSSVVDVEGIPVPLIGIDDLIASKRTGRPLDTLDIEVLEEIRRLRREES